MSDSRLRLERWRSVGRLLPRDTRERVFEPAFGELAHSWLTSERGGLHLPFAIQALRTYLGCFWRGLPRLLVQEGRLTRLGRVSVWTATALVMVGLVVANMAAAYASYDR